jgi:AraC-like DNA-binding protein
MEYFIERLGVARIDGRGGADVFIVFEDRPSDSPFIERVWRSHSERAGRFVSVAESHVEMVVSRVRGTRFLTLRGPETRATQADCPADGEWVGIRFTLGTFLPQHPVHTLIDRQDEHLPDLGGRFCLDGSHWDYPDFDNAETFVRRLAQRGVIARDDTVAAAMQGDHQARSRRTTQRHFLHAAGLTHGSVRQIERARCATNLLMQGASILDAAHDAGYFDQAHLTRSLRHYIGQTPSGIARGDEQLSFLYKTTPRKIPMMANGAAPHDYIDLKDHLDRARPQRAGRSVPALR